ncbi:FecR family protein [Sphingomonas mollis]|uniref:FecR domain-containing protein n=1 Tax=Sphingomonas mollis TaxID=2795726 RepID=A0ABS0XTC1_9SPHN|nr:FecR domain-containing protein [Sphingomonas sp. BT553]MBJ6122988.1 FecR domain-containing protein [Sphingomonas sp. BT553]
MIADRRSAVVIEEEAARWILRREEPEWTERDEAELASWLDLAMTHRAAFWRLEHGWQAADRIAALGEARAAGPLRRRRSSRWTKMPDYLPRWALSAGIAASLTLAVGGIWWGGPIRPWGKAETGDYRTPQGGRRSLTLADGSHVDMNTATLLRRSPDLQGREVWLDSGEAYFDIVHDPGRPFVVHAGPRTITVLGTRFSVRNDGAKVTVVVLSGRVNVRDTQASAGSIKSVVVDAGDIAVARADRIEVDPDLPEKVEALTAWRDGRIVFDNTPLADAVAEFNRYGNPPMRTDPAVGTLRIGGSFRTDEADNFVALLQRAYGVRVSRKDRAIVLSR